MIEQSESYVNEIGNKIWCLPSKGKLHYHRLDGPAIEFKSGSKAWFLNNERHRLDGHAIERADGTKAWFINGKRHRLDGPAIEWVNGTKAWFVNGIELSTKEVETWIKENDVDLKTLEGQMTFKLRWL